MIDFFLSPRIFFNGQSRNCEKKGRFITRTGFMSILFLSYINDLPQGLHIDVKLSDDNTSLL